MLKTCMRLDLYLPQRLQISLAQSRKSGYEICICDNVCMIFISLLLLFPLLTLFTFFFRNKIYIFNKTELNGLAFSTTSEPSL